MAASALAREPGTYYVSRLVNTSYPTYRLDLRVGRARETLVAVRDWISRHPKLHTVDVCHRIVQEVHQHFGEYNKNIASPAYTDALVRVTAIERALDERYKTYVAAHQNLNREKATDYIIRLGRLAIEWNKYAEEGKEAKRRILAPFSIEGERDDATTDLERIPKHQMVCRHYAPLVMCILDQLGIDSYVMSGRYTRLGEDDRFAYHAFVAIPKIGLLVEGTAECSRLRVSRIVGRSKGLSSDGYPVVFTADEMFYSFEKVWLVKRGAPLVSNELGGPNGVVPKFLSDRLFAVQTQLAREFCGEIPVAA